MSESLRRSTSELEHADDQAPIHGTPGKRSLTSSLAGRPQIVFRVESAEAVNALFGPRDPNGVAAGADAAVDRAAGSSGMALPEDLRGRFESSLGADLSGVRIHTGGESAEASSAVGAKAYTTGQDIHFGEGQYDPSSAFGVHLLAHEVAHTVQQQGATPTRQNKLEVSAPQDSAEIEADRAADAMVSGQSTTVARNAISVFRSPFFGPGVSENPSEAQVPECEQSELRWDVAGGPEEMRAPWSGKPQFDHADCATPANAYADQEALSADWNILQGSWNAAVPLYSAYKTRAAQAEAMLNETDLKLAGPGSSKDKLGDISSKVSGRKLGDSFEGDTMKTDPTTMLVSADLSEPQRADMVKTRAALTDTVTGPTGTMKTQGGVRTAATGVMNACSLLEKAVTTVTIKNNDLETAKLADAQGELEIVKAEWVGIVKSMTAVSKGIATASPGEVLGGVGSLIETSATKQYSIEIQELKSKCNALNVNSKNAEVANAMVDVLISARNIGTAITALNDASDAYDTSMRARRTAYRDMSLKVRDLAVENGASDEDAGQLQIALQAMPVVEQIVACLADVEGALVFPTYSAASGRGAALALNGIRMPTYYGIMKSNQAELRERRITWGSRLEQLQGFVDSL